MDESVLGVEEGGKAGEPAVAEAVVRLGAAWQRGAEHLRRKNLAGCPAGACVVSGVRT